MGQPSLCLYVCLSHRIGGFGRRLIPPPCGGSMTEGREGEQRRGEERNLVVSVSTGGGATRVSDLREGGAQICSSFFLRFCFVLFCQTFYHPPPRIAEDMQYLFRLLWRAQIISCRRPSTQNRSASDPVQRYAAMDMRVYRSCTSLGALLIL